MVRWFLCGKLDKENGSLTVDDQTGFWISLQEFEGFCLGEVALGGAGGELRELGFVFFVDIERENVPGIEDFVIGRGDIESCYLIFLVEISR